MAQNIYRTTQQKGEGNSKKNTNNSSKSVTPPFQGLIYILAHFRYSLIPGEDQSITIPSEPNGNHRNKPINTKKTTKCLQGKTIYNMIFCKCQLALDNGHWKVYSNLLLI